MKKLSHSFILWLLFIATLSLLSYSPPKRIPFCGFSIKNGFFYDNYAREYITKEASLGDKSGIPDIVDKIEKTLNFNVEIAVYLAKNENNCWATTGQGGKRLLVTDVDFLDEVNTVSGTKWAAISVIAHEVGHHIAGFGRHPNQLDDELDADYWSGYTLEKLGASKNASTKCIMQFGTEEDTQSHPNKYSRANIIKKGWDDALNNTIDYSKCENCKP